MYADSVKFIIAQLGKEFPIKTNIIGLLTCCTYFFMFGHDPFLDLPGRQWTLEADTTPYVYLMG